MCRFSLIAFNAILYPPVHCLAFVLVRVNLMLFKTCIKNIYVASTSMPVSYFLSPSLVLTRCFSLPSLYLCVFLSLSLSLLVALSLSLYFVLYPSLHLSPLSFPSIFSFSLFPLPPSLYVSLLLFLSLLHSIPSLPLYLSCCLPVLFCLCLFLYLSHSLVLRLPPLSLPPCLSRSLFLSLRQSHIIMGIIVPLTHK